MLLKLLVGALLFALLVLLELLELLVPLLLAPLDGLMLPAFAPQVEESELLAFLALLVSLTRSVEPLALLVVQVAPLPVLPLLAAQLQI